MNNGIIDSAAKRIFGSLLIAFGIYILIFTGFISTVLEANPDTLLNFVRFLLKHAIFGVGISIIGLLLIVKKTRWGTVIGSFFLILGVIFITTGIQSLTFAYYWAELTGQEVQWSDLYPPLIGIIVGGPVFIWMGLNDIIFARREGKKDSSTSESPE